MSSVDLRRLGRVGVLFAAASLGGCLRPLYGPTASGERTDDVLASIEVAPIAAPFGQEPLGHYLRSELVFDLDGSGRPAPKLYKLEVQVSERSQSPLVDTETGRAARPPTTAPPSASRPFAPRATRRSACRNSCPSRSGRASRPASCPARP